MAKGKYRVIITPEARDDLKREIDFIRRKWSAARAGNVQNDLLDEIDKLDTFPNRHPEHQGLTNQRHTYRFVPKWSYLIIYRVEEDLKRVRVVSIFSTAQNPENIDDVQGR